MNVLHANKHIQQNDCAYNNFFTHFLQSTHQHLNLTQNQLIPHVLPKKYENVLCFKHFGTPII